MTAANVMVAGVMIGPEKTEYQLSDRYDAADCGTGKKEGVYWRAEGSPLH